LERPPGEDERRTPLAARDADTCVANVETEDYIGHGGDAGGQAASAPGTLASAASRLAGSLMPACAMSALPPPPPPTLLAIARTRLPALAPRSRACGVVLATINAPLPTTTRSAPVRLSWLSAAFRRAAASSPSNAKVANEKPPDSLTSTGA